MDSNLGILFTAADVYQINLSSAVSELLGEMHAQEFSKFSFVLRIFIFSTSIKSGAQAILENLALDLHSAAVVL